MKVWDVSSISRNYYCDRNSKFYWEKFSKISSDKVLTANTTNNNVDTNNNNVLSAESSFGR